ncbi:MAG TPA: AMP-binding protein [Acidocella sp.]|nr:AMP-binding protein [Acidocella sp.]HQU03315.1 AMP-binding protein [Acidocella sp.]
MRELMTLRATLAQPEQAVAAMRAGGPVSVLEFRRDVAALAARLPGRGYAVNLCTDRYRFMISLVASLARGQVNLMPAANVPAALTVLAEDYQDSYTLTDEFVAGQPGGVLSGTVVDPLALAADQPAVILFTSGSTGRPQPVLKNWGTLRNSVQAAGARLGLERLQGGTIIGTVPHQHSYGLESVILLGLLHGLAVESRCPLYPADIRAALAAATGPRILVTTPVHLKALLAVPEHYPPADLILSATAPLSVELANAAEACFGAPLIEIYGCTEAGQLATRRTAHETAWHCLDGVELHQDALGTWASGPAVPGPTLLHDLIELSGAGRFKLGARAADMIDVAGKRSSLAYLNSQLLEIDGVQDGVFVMGVAQGNNVARLAALVVAPGLDAPRIMAALRTRIDAAFLPRPLLLVPALPRNTLGKLPRAELLKLIGQAL